MNYGNERLHRKEKESPVKHENTPLAFAVLLQVKGGIIHNIRRDLQFLSLLGLSSTLLAGRGKKKQPFESF